MVISLEKVSMAWCLPEPAADAAPAIAPSSSSAAAAAAASAEEVDVELVRPSEFLVQGDVSVAEDLLEDRALNTLTDLSMRVTRGMLVAVVGPVGCGKSSLLNCLIGRPQNQRLPRDRVVPALTRTQHRRRAGT